MCTTLVTLQNIKRSTILDKSPWDSNAIIYSYFSVISQFPHKTGHPFRNFLAVLTPPTLTKLKLENNSGYMSQHCFGVEGRGWKMLQIKCRSVPTLLSRIVECLQALYPMPSCGLCLLFKHSYTYHSL